MEEYLKQKKNWADSLALAGEPYPESQLISNVTSGLDIEYLPIILHIEARSSTTWQELQGILLAFENKMERLQNLSINNITHSNQQLWSLNAHLANRSNFSNRGRGNSTHNPSQSNPNNFRNNYTRGTSNTRGRGGLFNRSKPTCQVCSRYGHSSTICYELFDELYMGSNPKTNNQGNQRQTQ